ncbi:MAG: GAF domain-containing sensor histidine kinase [Chloroflexi bacterium]|nr:GAF domain-containing sensor histidine kinase [Chloroflexota bacterium]
MQSSRFQRPASHRLVSPSFPLDDGDSLPVLGVAPHVDPALQARMHLPPHAVLGQLLRLTEVLAGELDLDQVYQTVLAVVKEVTGADRVSIQLLSDDGNHLVLTAGTSLPLSVAIGQTTPAEEGIAGWVLRHQHPLLLVGSSHPNPEVQALLAQTIRQPPAIAPGTAVVAGDRLANSGAATASSATGLPRNSRRAGGAKTTETSKAMGTGESALCVPLCIRGRVLGVLNATKRDRLHPFRAGNGHYGPADLELAQELARRVALALENARLYQEAQAQAARQTALNAALHDTLRERDAALIQAHAALHLRDRFIALAAHELRTPITVLRGCVQLLLRHTSGGTRGAGTAANTPLTSERVQRWLHLINERADRLTRLAQQLLDVSRLDLDRLDLDRQPTDVTELVEEVVMATRVLRAAALTPEALGPAPAHRLIVEAPGPILAQVDRIRVEQVLTNLVDNALTHSASSKRIEVTVAQPSASLVAIRVRDHGVGVPPEHRARLFDRFYQVQAVRPVKGLGLGLYLSRQIAEAHGGTLEAEFPPDGGSAFILTLPLAAPAEPAPSAAVFAEKLSAHSGATITPRPTSRSSN